MELFFFFDTHLLSNITTGNMLYMSFLYRALILIDLLLYLVDVLKCSSFFSRRINGKMGLINAVLSNIFFFFSLNVFKVEMVLVYRLALYRGFLSALMILLFVQLTIFVAFSCQTVLNFHLHFV